MILSEIITFINWVLKAPSLFSVIPIIDWELTVAKKETLSENSVEFMILGIKYQSLLTTQTEVVGFLPVLIVKK